MSDKPIIFSAPMVRALLEGRKTQTRRVLKPQPHERARGCYRRPNGSWVWVDAYRENNGTGFFGNRLDDTNFRLPYAPGDRLYVREAALFWIKNSDNSLSHVAAFRADGYELEPGEKWRPSIHMPRWASRLTLTVTDVRVQRLQEISEADAMAEGMVKIVAPNGHVTYQVPDLCGGQTPVRAFHILWNSLHGPEAWDANPWVAAYTFRPVLGNIDMLADRAAQ